MTLKTSLLITGDASVAKKAVDDLARSVDALGTSSKGTAQALAAADTVEKAAASSTKAMAAAQTEAATSNQTLAAAAKAAGGAVGSAAGDVQRATGAALAATSVAKEHTKAANDNAAAANRNAYGLRSLGQQFGDFGLQVSAGIDPIRAFSQQSGQMGYALSEMGGKAGAVGAFLTGPWGIALTVGFAVLAPFVAKLFEGAEAAKAVELASSGLGDAESALADIFGKTSSKIAEQNELLKINARIKAINLRTDAAKDASDAKSTFTNAGRVSTGGSLARGVLLGVTQGAADLGNFNIGTANRNVQGLAARARAANAIADPAAQTKAFTDLLKQAERTDFKGSEIDKSTFIGAVSKAAAGRANARIAGLIDASLDGGKIDPLLQKGGGSSRKAKGPAKPKKAADYGGLLTSTQNDVDTLTAQFTDAPTRIEKARTAVAKLQADIDQLDKRKPIGFASLIASAREAQGVIQANINKPFQDYLDAQQQELVYQQLTLSGDADQAKALREIARLQGSLKPLTADERGEVLATVQALDLQARQIDILREKNRKYLDALGDIRGVVDDATQAFVRGELGQLIKAPGRLLDAFQTLQGQALFDKLFAGAFRDLQDQVNGVSPVKDAATRMAASVDQVSNASDRTADAFARLSTAAIQAKGAFDGTAGTHTLGGGKIGDDLYAKLSQGNGVEGRDIVVTGPRRGTEVKLFSEALGKAATSITGIFTNPENAKNIGTTVGRYAGKGLEGAATGTLVNGIIAPIGKALGVKTSQVGAQIGGALGSISGIPGGQIIGSIVGSVLGGLLGAKKSNGSATVEVGKTGTFQATAGTGASAEYAKQANTLATSLAGGLQQIADALGGTAKGASGISIGVNNGNFHVNSVGGAIGQKGSGDVNFGQDQAGAVAYALQQEVAKGAISGLSGAVAKALQSSPDIDSALKEALKVADVETLLGGVVGQYAKAFKNLEITARDRVRIAQQYGFDVLAIEKRNADDRKKLADQLAKAQAGSLQSLLDEIKLGSLFEGSALDKITALSGAIAKAKADLDAGVEGAGDQLANLYQKRLEASKDAYGTTAGYAADRNATIGEAQAAIGKINAQIASAQSKSDPALVTTNKSLDENNDQNAQIIDALKRNNELLQLLNAAGAVNGKFNLNSLAST